MRLLLVFAVVFVVLTTASLSAEKRAGPGAWFMRPAWRPTQKRMFSIPLFHANYEDWEMADRGV